MHPQSRICFCISGSGTATLSSSRSSLSSIEEEEGGDFSGLNSIMTMNNRQGFLTRGQAATGVVANKPVPPSGYFCTKMGAPPSRPATLALSKVISKPSASVPTVPKSQTAGTEPETTAKVKDNQVKQTVQHGGTSTSGSSSGDGMVMSSSSRPVASCSVAKGNIESQSKTTTGSSVSDSLLKHMGSAHMRSGATSGTGAAAALSQQKSKSGGQML